MKKKSKGAGIMVSDFIDEHNGFLALTDKEYQAAKVTNPNIRPYAREFLEYGESKEGYWTRDKFSIEQLRLLRSNTQKREVGVMFGCLITAAVMLLWQTMPWMSMP